MSVRPAPPPPKTHSAPGGASSTARPSKPGRAAPGLPEERQRDDRDVGDAVEASGAALRPDDDADDPTVGDWLFKQNDMVLGPVTAAVLVERIKQGQLPSDTPIARDGQPFKPMKLVALFREAHEATLERKRRDAATRDYEGAVRRAQTLRAALLAGLFLGPAGAGAVGGHALMTLKPWDDTPDWIAKAPSLVDLPPRPPAVTKAKTPVPRGDDAPPTNDGDDAPAVDGDRRRIARGDRSRDRAGARDKRGDDKVEPTARVDDKGADQGFVKELTNEQAIAPLKDVKAPLGACFRAEIEANPGVFVADATSVVITLAYTITEEGRSANVEIKNRELRGRPVQDCVKKALAGARWPRFVGERKNLTVPFNLKKPKAPSP
jgi:hypothetical protein